MIKKLFQKLICTQLPDSSYDNPHIEAERIITALKEEKQEEIKETINRVDKLKLQLDNIEDLLILVRKK